ncbi:hypothetical protein ZWY2020_041881, partial [Hordeum vulgare]
FEEYAEKAKTLPDTTTNESKLCLYSLYKQATVGPVNTVSLVQVCLFLMIAASVNVQGRPVNQSRLPVAVSLRLLFQPPECCGRIPDSPPLS